MFAFIVPVALGLWALEAWAQTMDYAEQELIGWMVGPVMLIVLLGWDAFYGYRMAMVWRDARRAGWWIAVTLAVPVVIWVLFDAARQLLEDDLGLFLMVMPATMMMAVMTYGSMVGGAAAGFGIAQAVLRRGQPNAPAAWCGECHQYVWLDAQGCCPKGHPRESLGQPYSAHPV